MRHRPCSRLLLSWTILLFLGHASTIAGAQTASELRSLATQVLAKEQQSPKVDDMIAACSTTSLPAPDCSGRLRAVADDERAAMPTRLAAAGGRVIREEPKAAELFETLAGRASFEHLFQALPVLERLPPGTAAPPLIRLLESGDDRFAVAAARVLGNIQSPASASALQAAVARSITTSPLWLTANISLARLGVADGLRIAGSTHPYLGPDDLLAAGEAFQNAGDPRADPFLLLVTRKSDGLPRLRAAALMADRRPDQFQTFLAQALASTDASVRAEAITIAGKANAAVPTEIARFLRDPAATVRIRAADLILAKTREREK